MDFTIYSIGDAAFLEQILNSVAMICGTNDLNRIVAIGLLLGFFAIVMQSIFEGAKSLNVQHVFIGWIMYAAFYGPSCTIKIEDVYSGQVRVVSNVPIGVGITGGIVSKIGYGLTSMFEQGFQISGNVSNSKYNESLKLLSETRRTMYSNAIFSALDQSLGGGNVDSKQSIVNYMKECPLVKVDLNIESLTKLMTQEIDKSMKFSSNVFGTTLYLNPNGAPQNYTCSEAWTHIQNLTSNLATGVLAYTLTSVLDIDSTHGDSASNKINDSLQMMGLSSLNANMYVKLSLLEPLYNEAAMGKYQDMQDYSSALMINQAIQQRNAQWSSEQTLFMTTVRPLVTFFEGFVYALTPIMAFIIVLGGMGIKLIGRYIQVVLWIQLWLPVLAITNLYIYMASREELIAINSTSASALDSFYALNATTDKLDTWIATGGMLAAATPLIALFVISGSSYAFTNLAGRLNGADFTNEKINTPDALNNGPVMSTEPENKFNVTSGGMNSGAESLLGSINIGQNAQSSLSSAKEELKQSSSAFTSTLSNAVSSSVSDAESYQKVASIGQSISSSNSSEAMAIKNQAKSFMEQNKISDQHSDAVTGAFALAATGTLQGNISKGIGKKTEGGGKSDASVSAGIAGQASGKSTSTANDSSPISAEDINNYSQQNSLSDSQKAALIEELAGNLSKQNSETLTKTFGDTAAKQIANSASNLVSTSNKYSEASNLVSSLGVSTNSDIRAMAGLVAKSPQSMKELNNAFSYAPEKVKQEAASLEDALIKNGMTNTTVAQQAARITAMTNPNNFENTDSRLSSLNSALSAIGTATGKNMGTTSNASENNGISNSNPHSSDVQDVDKKYGETTARVNNGLNNNLSLAGENTPGKEAVNEKYNTDKGDLKANADAHIPESIKKAESYIMNSTPNASWASSQYGAYDNAKNKIARAAEQIGGAFESGSSAASETFSNTINNLGSMNNEELSAFQTDMANNKQDNIDKYGSLVGKVINGFGSAYKSAIGASVSGYQTAKNWITGESSNLSETAKNMSLEERGAYYLGAYQAAIDAGSEKASEFMSTHGSEFKNTMSEIGQNRYGLTEKQAAIYAESFDTNPTRMSQAVSSLKEDYAERDTEGNIIRNDQGQPVLSDYYEKFTDKMASQIVSATDAGNQTGAYLTGIRNYNTAVKTFKK